MIGCDCAQCGEVTGYRVVLRFGFHESPYGGQELHNVLFSIHFIGKGRSSKIGEERPFPLSWKNIQK